MVTITDAMSRLAKAMRSLEKAVNPRYRELVEGRLLANPEKLADVLKTIADGEPAVLALDDHGLLQLGGSAS